MAKGGRQQTVLELVNKPSADIVERLGRTSLDGRATPPSTASKSAPVVEQSAADSYNLTVQRALDLRRQLDTVSEQQLLSDIVSVLRGVDGEYIVYEEERKGFMLKPRIGLSGLTRGFVEQILFYADHYKRIGQRVGMREKGMGRIRSAYCQQVNRELTLYSEEVVRFEKELFLPERTTQTAGKTLPELLLKLSKWRLFLLTLDSITHSLDSQSGPHLLDGLLKYVDHDEKNPTAKMTVRLFDHCMSPIMETVDRFIKTGTIDDPFNEFFLKRLEQEGDEEDVDWWNKRYVIVSERIPKHLADGEVVQSVLSLGKTRALLNDGELPNNNSTIEHPPQSFNLMVDEWERLYREQGRQAVSFLLDKHHLLEHLQGIKRFMLLAEGDFSRSLMELLSEALSKPASTLLRHNLVGILESAADRHPDPLILPRLDVRLLESTNPKSQGWDVFCLDYRLDRCLSVVVSQESMLEYARMSHFLWSLKRVEFAVSAQWGRLTRARRLFTGGELAVDQRRLELLIAEMHTFIQQLLSAAYQSIEGLHQKMIISLKVANSVDQMISLHGDFIKAVKRSFLPWSLPTLRTKLGQICASCLRADSLGKHFHNHAIFLQEKQRRERNLPISVPEDRFQSFLASHTKQLAEHRSLFQTIARAFQSELDEFIGAVQREAATGEDADKASVLLAMIDMSGYHSRRVGFDVKKYVK